MTCHIDMEVENKLDFPYEELFEKIAATVLKEEKCPYEAVVSLLITDNDSIREINREYRHTDKETDVLSFPMAEYKIPADFSMLDGQADCFDP
ncbi:MAG TPA: rRNA maturation RNase YbeY, partial [Lachnospiraceae bacterium]|nr:rRNA maturation RNase YbeY [Lachnospiraceae bacterium]